MSFRDDAVKWRAKKEAGPHGVDNSSEAILFCQYLEDSHLSIGTEGLKAM